MSHTALQSPVAVNVVVAHPLDDEQYGVDFTDRLPSGVTVSSAVLTQKLDDGTTTTDLALGAAAANTGTFTNHKGVTVAIGAGVLFTVTGGIGGSDYLITVVATCSDSKVRAVVCRFEVRDGDEEA